MYNDNSNLAYDLSLFDVDEELERKKARKREEKAAIRITEKKAVSRNGRVFAALIAGSQFVKYVGGFPEIEHFVFVFDDIDPSIDFFELSLFLRHCSSLSKESDNSR